MEEAWNEGVKKEKVEKVESPGKVRGWKSINTPTTKGERLTKGACMSLPLLPFACSKACPFARHLSWEIWCI